MTPGSTRLVVASGACHGRERDRAASGRVAPVCADGMFTRPAVPAGPVPAPLLSRLP